VLGLQQAGAFGKGPAGVLAAVPFMRADGGEEMLHRHLVAGEQLAVEVAGIPVDQHAAKIEHDGIAGHLRHRPLYWASASCACSLVSARMLAR